MQYSAMSTTIVFIQQTSHLLLRVSPPSHLEVLAPSFEHVGDATHFPFQFRIYFTRRVRPLIFDGVHRSNSLPFEETQDTV